MTKKTHALLSLSSIAFTFTGSLFVLAQTSTSPRSNTQKTTLFTSDFCSSLDSSLKKIDSRNLSVQQMSLFEKSLSANKQPLLIGNIDAKRVEISALRKIIVDELGKRATSTEDKQAINLFSSRIEEAVKKKDESVNELFLQAADVSQTSNRKRQVAIAEATSTFATRIEEAKNSARSNCRQGTPSGEVKLSFRKAVDSAQTELNSSLQTISNSSEKNLLTKDAYRSKIESIMSDYRLEINNAKATLKKNFKNLKSV